MANTEEKISPCKEHIQYSSYSWIECIDSYKSPDDGKYWAKCIKCEQVPKVWEFDNGRYTACGCWESKYRHWSVCAESIGSVYTRIKKGEDTNYDFDGLRKNWNCYNESGEIIFDRSNGGREDGRW
jgi:hypothetical protein